MPEQMQSPLLTAEWEYRLGEIERGQLAPEEAEKEKRRIKNLMKDVRGKINDQLDVLYSLPQYAPGGAWQL